MINQDTRQRFDELLPWYVNGTLDASGRQWIEGQLERYPELRAEVDWTASLQQRMREATPEFAPEPGLDKLMARIHHERETSLTPVTARAEAPRPGLLAGLSALLERFRLTPAFAMAAVVLVQFGVIGVLLDRESDLKTEFDQYRSVTAGQVVTGPALEVVFKSDALERQIRETLVRIGGTLAGGPGQLGIYLVYVPADEIEKAKTELEGNPIVELVTVAKPAAGAGGS